MGYVQKGVEPLSVRVRTRLKEKDELEFVEFPGLSKEDLEEVNGFYKHYLFYEKKGGGRLFDSSCCHQKARYLDSTGERTVTDEIRNAVWGTHNDEIRCPFCGRPVTLKSIGRSKTAKNLTEYIPVVLFHTAEGGETVYAQSYWTVKDYRDNRSAEPLYKVTKVYRFRRGEAVCWEAEYGDQWSKQVNGFFSEPFRGNGFPGSIEPYSLVGLDRLEDSFLRYTEFKRSEDLWGGYRWGRKQLLRFLCLAAQYPENVEMLMKAGMRDVVEDWTLRHKKNAAAICWAGTNPGEAFGLGKPELKAFLKTNRNIDILTLYKRIARHGEKLGMKEIADILAVLPFSEAEKLLRLCKKHAIKVSRLLRYLVRFDGLYAAFEAWEDYLTAAEALHYELWKDGILLPKELYAAHNDATRKHAERLEAEARKERAAESEREKEQARLALLAQEKRREQVENRYGYCADGLLIRAPKNEAEIVREGKLLCHCVGGYALRHTEGKTTILLMRHEKLPDKPFLTLEMNGSQLVQIHGWKNEGIHSNKGRFAPDPRALYKDFLNPWLKWVQNGSRRTKKGKPVLPHSKNKEAQIA